MEWLTVINSFTHGFQLKNKVVGPRFNSSSRTPYRGPLGNRFLVSLATQSSTIHRPPPNVFPSSKLCFVLGQFVPPFVSRLLLTCPSSRKGQAQRVPIDGILFSSSTERLVASANLPELSAN